MLWAPASRIQISQRERPPYVSVSSPRRQQRSMRCALHSDVSSISLCGVFLGPFLLTAPGIRVNILGPTLHTHHSDDQRVARHQKE